jgi:DNA modification methylase
MYKSHPAANEFPLFNAARLAELSKDILKNGQREAIKLFDNQIVDGRNRYQACKMAGVEPKFDTLTGVDPWSYVWSLNGERRDLTADQRYLIWKSCSEQSSAWQAERQRIQDEANEKRSEATKAQPRGEDGTRLASYQVVPHIVAAPGDKQVERTSAAKAIASKTNRGAVERMDSLSKARPELAEQVKVGTITSADAQKIIKQESLAAKKEELLRVSQSELVDNRPQIRHCSYRELFKAVPDRSIDLLITDPPYSTDIDDIEGFVGEWLFAALDKVKKNGRAFICIGAYPKEIAAYLNALAAYEGFIVDNPLIWTYRNTLGITPKHKYNLNYQVVLHLYSTTSKPLDTSITNEMFSVQDINAPDGRQGDRHHTWQKPDELGLRLIRHATTEGDTILDPFACTGTFSIAAAKLGRSSIACDISRENLSIAEKRGCVVI